jgi:hypothetical protein
MGSQRRQTPGDTGRCPATITAANWLFRRHLATSCDGTVTSYKRGVTGSNPVAPTNSALRNYIPISNVHLGVGRGPDAIGFLSPA